MFPFVRVLIVVAAFAAFHSLTAKNGFRTWARRKTSLSYASYAAVRAAVSLVLLVFSLFLLFQDAHLTTQLFSPLLGVPAILPAVFSIWLAGMALGQIVRARRLPQFFGFEEFPKLFVFTGAYTFCRHPMYAAWLAAAWGLVISKPFLLTLFYNCLITGFVMSTARQEERQMIALFGDRYRAYQKQVPFLLPYGFLLPRIRKKGTPKF